MLLLFLLLRLIIHSNSNLHTLKIFKNKSLRDSSMWLYFSFFFSLSLSFTSQNSAALQIVFKIHKQFAILVVVDIIRANTHSSWVLIGSIRMKTHKTFHRHLSFFLIILKYNIKDNISLEKNLVVEQGVNIRHFLLNEYLHKFK